MKGFLRPKAEVLPASATIPEKNLVVPPPNHFTHELTRRVAYFYDEPHGAKTPDGEFPEGTRVLLVQRNDEYCRVADARGLYVAVARDSLRKLDA